MDALGQDRTDASLIPMCNKLRASRESARNREQARKQRGGSATV
jgi:hypothetical protein